MPKRPCPAVLCCFGAPSQKSFSSLQSQRRPVTRPRRHAPAPAGRAPCTADAATRPRQSARPAPTASAKPSSARAGFVPRGAVPGCRRGRRWGARPAVQAAAARVSTASARRACAMRPAPARRQAMRMVGPRTAAALWLRRLMHPPQRSSRQPLRRQWAQLFPAAARASTGSARVRSATRWETAGP